ncbi:hypothetical protein F2Q69_00050389 [Brassica cretica]|uniref:DUF4378 domain-containing protein n=1 Tax=Brassica cretica TaxID=69181 RepID=A0A8S9PYB6_BRACR|nr:hypothetical protein F2Q69_00050389 [Brassica cretica]
MNQSEAEAAAALQNKQQKQMVKKYSPSSCEDGSSANLSVVALEHPIFYLCSRRLNLRRGGTISWSQTLTSVLILEILGLYVKFPYISESELIIVSSCHPINPELFFVLEKTKGSSTTHMLLKEESKVLNKEKLYRTLVFDTVNNILVEKLVRLKPPRIH